jgi:YD repeat-containing protein
MGNNDAYSNFQFTVITLYDHGVLTLDILDSFGNYACTYPDIDSGGDTGLTTKDGKTLEQVCIEIVDPEWKPVKSTTVSYDDPDHWKWEEEYNKWEEITGRRWGWNA